MIKLIQKLHEVVHSLEERLKDPKLTAEERAKLKIKLEIAQYDLYIDLHK